MSSITVTGGRLNLFKSVQAMQNYCAAVGISENKMESYELEIKNVYPNPATNTLNIVYNSFESVDIHISNVLGQEIKYIKSDSNTKGIQHSRIDVSGLDKGIYFISLFSSNKKSNVVKVIIE
jgi:hypothetical protein